MQFFFMFIYLIVHILYFAFLCHVIIKVWVRFLLLSEYLKTLWSNDFSLVSQNVMQIHFLIIWSIILINHLINSHFLSSYCILSFLKLWSQLLYCCYHYFSLLFHITLNFSILIYNMLLEFLKNFFRCIMLDIFDFW